MRRKLKETYEEVKTPQVIDRSLWEKSGHWDKFQEHMFMAKGMMKKPCPETDELSWTCSDI